jgi:hypothetical protein
MQLPLSLYFPEFLRGLLGFMDEQEEQETKEEPLGLFGHFASEFGEADEFDEDDEFVEDEEDPDATASGGTRHQDGRATWIADDPSQVSSLDYARRQAELALWEIATMGPGGLTRDPLTGEWNASKDLTRLGNRMSGIAMQVPGGPGLLKGPPPRLAPGPVTAIPAPKPGFLFGGPQTGGAEDAEDQVHHLPGSGGLYYEESDAESEAKARAAERAKENWRNLCTKVWEREKFRCGNNYSYDSRDLKACEKRAFGRYEKCLRDEDETERQWTDADVDGGFVRKPLPKRWKFNRRRKYGRKRKYGEKYKYGGKFKWKWD